MKPTLLASPMQTFFVGCLAALLAVATRAFGEEAVRRPGPQPNGSILLPNMWSLQPTGTQIHLGDFPVNIAVHPDGTHAAVLHAGHGAHEIQLVDLATCKVTQRVKVEETFYGLEFASSGKRLFASGASSEVVRFFDFDKSTHALGPEQHLVLRKQSERGIPAGLALSSDAQSLFVANLLGHGVSRIQTESPGDPVLHVPLARDPQAVGGAPVPGTPRKTERSADEAAISKRAEAALDPNHPLAPFPYACRLDERRKRLYVSLWAQAEVAVVDLENHRIEARWKTGGHPNEMLLSANGRLLYVANGNDNTVQVIDTGTGEPLETIWAALHPQSPPGCTPNSLALTPDEKTLYIANANVNAVAVFDVAERGKARSMGFIPTGWYPTSVRVTPDGKKLLIANGKGIASKANPRGPQPGRKTPPGTTVEYIAGLFHGTLSVIDLPKRSEWEQLLEKHTATVYRCSPATRDNTPIGKRPVNSPIPGELGGASPIQHCIYVIKENRTYDQVFGDMKEGKGDASLCLFPEKITPNHHKLAREFVLLDNFYVESEVSADGHEWSMAAYATDFVEKFWPLSYGHAKSRKYSYPSEGNFPIATPAGGYIWDRAREAGVSYRSYGEFVQNGKTPNDPCRAKVKSLEGHIDPYFRSFDMDYPDVKRAERFISELHRFEAEGAMPRLQIVRLPQDHTSGTTPGKWTPTACVAENDLALGMLVEAVSRSKFWASTAIFVVEDDAQNGPDHIDAHRTVALVISPYSRKGTVDSTLYSTSSMLRTMELVLGLRPMSQFDAAAIPMYASFQSTADTRPYHARPANVDVQELNSKLAWGASQSKKLNFKKEDAADDLVLNEIIWRSVRGAHWKMPAPRRAAFVFAPPTDSDGD